MDIDGWNRWWDAPTLHRTRKTNKIIQQKEHVRQVGWEYPTMKVQQATNNKRIKPKNKEQKCTN